MAIAICSFCGGLVIMHASMCPHCGQRGEARPSRRKVSTFGAKQRMPLVVKRLIVVAIVGGAAVFTLALAHFIRPKSTHQLEELTTECEDIARDGEEFVGELLGCQAKLNAVRVQDMQRRAPP